jgi:hypothetical protein
MGARIVYSGLLKSNFSFAGIIFGFFCLLTVFQFLISSHLGHVMPISLMCLLCPTSVSGNLPSFLKKILMPIARKASATRATARRYVSIR